MDVENMEAVDSGPMLSLRDLRVSYGDREILPGITFDVMQGETLVFLGGWGWGRARFCGPWWDWRSLVRVRFGLRARTLRSLRMTRWMRFGSGSGCRSR